MMTMSPLLGRERAAVRHRRGSIRVGRAVEDAGGGELVAAQSAEEGHRAPMAVRRAPAPERPWVPIRAAGPFWSFIQVRR
jgi:hypothetical protein